MDMLKLHILKSYNFLLHVIISFYAFCLHVCMHSVCRGQKGETDFLKCSQNVPGMKGMAVNHHMGTGN